MKCMPLHETAIYRNSIWQGCMKFKTVKLIQHIHILHMKLSIELYLLLTTAHTADQNINTVSFEKGIGSSLNEW